MEDTTFIELQRLCRLVHDRGLRELSITRPDFTVKITAMSAESGMMLVPVPAAMPQAAAQPVAAGAAAAAEPVEEGYQVRSPLVGLFYRAPSPDSAPFVEIGDMVEAGQVVGIVEAMKVFNEITTDVAGRVKSLPVKNGKLVQVDETLVVLETSAS